MIDLRYHLASLVAVFFALGLGMLVGAQIVDEGTLTHEYGRLIEQVEDGLARVREDNRRLEDQLVEMERQLAAERAWVDDVLGELVAGRLGGVRVGVALSEGAASYGERIWTGLLRAGADVRRVEDVPGQGDGEGAGVTVFVWDGEELRLDPDRAVVGLPGGAGDADGRLPSVVGRVVTGVDTLQGLLELIGAVGEVGAAAAEGGADP